eukprot:423772-Alexandrium_andersonii.AAC.1
MERVLWKSPRTQSNDEATQRRGSETGTVKTSGGPPALLPLPGAPWAFQSGLIWGRSIGTSPTK